MKATRIDDWPGHALAEDLLYWKASSGTWMLYLPGCGIGTLTHQVTEHEDGTITVHPSIRMEGHDNGVRTIRHGWLIKGIWSEA